MEDRKAKRIKYSEKTKSKEAKTTTKVQEHNPFSQSLFTCEYHFFSQFFSKFLKDVFNNLHWFLKVFFWCNLYCFGTFMLHFIISRFLVVLKFCVNGYGFTWASVSYFNVILHYIWELCNIYI